MASFPVGAASNAIVVVAVAAGIDNTSAGATPTITGANIDTTLQNLASGVLGSAGVSQRYGDTPAAGINVADNLDPAGTGSSTRNAAALASFAPVPEPTTAALLLGGFGMLTLVRLRRRA